MGVTIIAAPQDITPAYNDIIFIAGSTNTAQLNHKFVADLYIGGVVIRLTATKDVTYNTGVFNIGRVVESYVSSDISKSTYEFQQNLNSYIPFYIKFGEQYGAVPVVYPDGITSSTYQAWNGIFDFLPFQSYTYTPYVLQSGCVKQLLTNKPTTVDIRDSEDAWLYAISASSGVVYDARIRTYDSAGTIIQTVKVNNPYQALSSTNDRYFRFGCGTSNLNSIASSGITSGSQPIITASVYSYDVTFETYSGTLVSTPQVFTVNNQCTKNDTFRFHFLNKLGGFDSFTFIRGSKKNVSIKRTSYSRNPNRSLSGTSYGYSKSDRGGTQLDTILKDNIKVLSDWINEDTSIWLEELITSPEVYLDDLTHGLVAVNILNSNYEIKQTAQDKLFNLEIEFEYAYERFRQRR
jgi:hypothetical protein